MAGLEPHVGVITESFMVLPFLLPGTDRIAMIPALLAQEYTRPPPSGWWECSFTFTDLVEHGVVTSDVRSRPGPLMAARHVGGGLTRSCADISGRCSSTPLIPVISHHGFPRTRCGWQSHFWLPATKETTMSSPEWFALGTISCRA